MEADDKNSTPNTSEGDRLKLVFAAAQKVMDALDGLTVAEQERVLRSAAELCGLALRGEVPPAPTLARPGSSSGSGQQRPLSLVEFMRDCGARTNAQKITAFAYYR